MQIGRQADAGIAFELHAPGRLADDAGAQRPQFSGKRGFESARAGSEKPDQGHGRSIALQRQARLGHQRRSSARATKSSRSWPQKGSPSTTYQGAPNTCAAIASSV